MPEKTPLVLLPGLLCDGALWRHQTETLADIAEVTVADLTGDDTMNGLVASVLDAAPETFALAGFSMGGYVAQEIMRRAGERVTRLALLGTAARADTPETAESRQAYLELAKKGQFKGITRRLLPLFIHPGRLGDEALSGAVRKMTERVGRRAFVNQTTATLNRADGVADLAAISCPTLVLVGRQDMLTPVGLHEEMAAAIPDSTLVVIEDCGHLAPMEQPHAVSAVMRYWLQRPR